MNLQIHKLQAPGRRSARLRAIARRRALRLPIRPNLELRRLQCYAALMLSDSVCVMSAFFSVTAYHYGMNALSGGVGLGALLLAIYLMVASYHRAYAWPSLSSTHKSVSNSIFAMVTSVTFLTVILFYLKEFPTFGRGSFTEAVVASCLLLVVSRIAMRRFIRWRCGAYGLNHILIQDGGMDISIPGAVSISAQSFGLVPALDNPDKLNRIGAIIQNADRVTISSVPERMLAWTVILKGANVEGEVLDETVTMLSAMGARYEHGYGLLQVSAGPLGIRDRLLKRAFDVIFAGLALIALSPVLLAVAAAVKLEDGGPVFFRQKRVGRGNRFFKMNKFRSMYVNKVGIDGSQSASKSDPRITKVGRFIRATSIDELPQLINVLLGDMSIVGPRPHATGSLAGDKLFWQVDHRYWERHALKPGLTGLAQVRGYRGATDTEDDLVRRLSADLEYSRGWTIWRDFWIILSTLRVLVHDKAY